VSGDNLFPIYEDSRPRIIQHYNYMKKLAFAASASIAMILSAQAGHPVVDKNPKNPVPEPCFADKELQIDTYAVYNNFNGADGFGGGLALNYYFHRNFGVGLDVNVSDASGDTAWNYGAHLLARYPVELGSVCLAPYLKVAGGVTDRDGSEGFVGVGGGLELRFSPHWGIFGEGSYNWASDDDDFAQARLGLRWVF
jgi:hypothetical protein